MSPKPKTKSPPRRSRPLASNTRAAPAPAGGRFGRHEYRRDDMDSRFEGGMDQGRHGRGFHFTPEDGKSG